MQLEDYFDAQSPTDIRVKGTRIGIETILLDYLEQGLFPEDIVLRYPTLTLEQVYATITYYWHDRSTIDAYLFGLESARRSHAPGTSSQPATGSATTAQIAPTTSVMPGHLQAHLNAGRHVPGIFVTPYPLNLGALDHGASPYLGD